VPPEPEPRLLPRGLSHPEALAREIPPANELVEGVVDAGTPGLWSGLPFSRKSWAAIELAHKVAAGRGDLFGRHPIRKGGPVIYCWQDESEAKMLGRIQAYNERHDYRDAPIRWLLGQGLRLPDDLEPLRRLVERDGAVLVCFDSFYNFAPGAKLKDEDAAAIITAAKAELCDPTGATVLFVDHAPWPTESNRGQRRAYGSVFKTAAARWSVHFEADPKDDTRLHVEASGNSTAGFRRTPATWDAQALEIRLLETKTLDLGALAEEILAYVDEHPGTATRRIAEGLGRRREAVSDTLETLETAGRLTVKASRDLGRPGTGRYWFPPNHAGSEASQHNGTTQGRLTLEVSEDGDRSHRSHPRRGDRSPTGPLETVGDIDEDEPLLARAHAREGA
jgi:hypothetical protein